ncbi:MAG: tetratricopeptide repeat protein [Bacteroidaceae bacterium]|nr:tetratricopeptide repeat protein [Bacteroidaceae bacterium]
MAKQPIQTAPENIEAVTVTEAFIDKYKKHIIYGCCAIVLIAAAWICYAQFISKPRNQKANEALFKCETYFSQENYEKALNGDGQGCIGFLKVADEFGSTKAGNLAHLYAGICYAQTEKFEEAKAELDHFSTKGDIIISPAALGLLGNVYANLGQNDKAIEYLLKAAKSADNASLSPTFLLQAGELYEAIGKPEKAHDCYKEIKNRYVNSMAYQDIDKYIERVSK